MWEEDFDDEDYEPIFCDGCGIDIFEIDEYSYIVHQDIWAKAYGYHNVARHPYPYTFMFENDIESGCLCVECLEKKTNYRLSHDDFVWNIPLNHCQGSERLESRKYSFEYF